MNTQAPATTDFTKMPIDEMEAIWSGGFKRARASLGLVAFGMSVSDLPPNYDRVPEHVHTFDGQEEVYIALAGSGWLEVGGERVPIDTERAIRVGPTATRRPISGPDGIRLLIIGGIPGAVYEPFGNSIAGAPEPAIPELPGVQAAQGHQSSDDFAALAFDQMEPFTSEDTGLRFNPIRKALGLTAFGISKIEITHKPEIDGFSGYPLHDHGEDGQEEAYVVAAGSGKLAIDGEQLAVSVGDAVRVAPGVSRRFIPDEGGLSFVAIGAPIGKPYEPGKRN